jgi:F420H(2)-dependent quinone reductase
MSTSTDTKQANATRKVRPISETKPPNALFKFVANPIMRRLLRSPKANIGDAILLLTFTGRKSGKQYTTPIGYRRAADRTLVLYTDSPWYKNLLGGAPVKVVLKGKEISGWAVASDDKDALVKEAAEYLRSRGPKAGREIGIMNLKFVPTEDELRVMFRDRAKITVQPGEGPR